MSMRKAEWIASLYGGHAEPCLTFLDLAGWTQRASDSLKIPSGLGETSRPLTSFLAAPTSPAGPSSSPHRHREFSESLSHCLPQGPAPARGPCVNACALKPQPLPLLLSRCVVSGWGGRARTWCCVPARHSLCSPHSEVTLGRLPHLPRGGPGWAGGSIEPLGTQTPLGGFYLRG